MTTRANLQTSAGAAFASDNQPDHADDPSGIKCDFCGQGSASVRRVALDRNYERLRTPHQERFACPDCSENKERRRLGLERG